jgi:hypothetical protein
MKRNSVGDGVVNLKLIDRLFPKLPTQEERDLTLPWTAPYFFTGPSMLGSDYENPVTSYDMYAESIFK